MIHVDGQFQTDASNSRNALIGARWRAGGRGLFDHDCLGLVLVWYRMAGIDIDDPCSTNPRTVTLELSRTFTRVENEARQFGDLVEIDVNDRTRPHLGVYLGDNEIINTTEAEGCHILKVENIVGEWRVYRLNQILEANK